MDRHRGAWEGELASDQEIQQILDSAPEVVPLPATATAILKRSNSPDATAKDLALILARDQALSARVLKVANSAFYGLRRQVASVNDAAILLGMRTVRNLALTASMTGLGVKPVTGYGLPRGELFSHSIVMAQTANHLSRETNKSIPDEAYTAGLLHDLGKLVLADHVAQKVEAIKEAALRDNISFAQAERGVLGLDHAEIAAVLADKWELPEFLGHAIRLHHGLGAGNGRSGDITSLAAVCILANQVGRLHGSGVGDNETADPPIEDSILEILGVKRENLEELEKEVERSIQAASELVAGG